MHKHRFPQATSDFLLLFPNASVLPLRLAGTRWSESGSCHQSSKATHLGYERDAPMLLFWVPAFSVFTSRSEYGPDSCDG